METRTLKKSCPNGRACSGGSGSSPAGQTILVSGLRGFTGHYLASSLRARGAQVIGLVQGDAQNADEISADLTDAASVKAAVTQVQPTNVVHLAGLAFVGHGDAQAFMPSIFSAPSICWKP